MNYEVYNRNLNVDCIHIIGVASSSLVMVGDTQTIQLATTYDTPAESLIIGPFVPLVTEAP